MGSQGETMLPGDMVPYADNPRSHVKMRSKKSVERYFDAHQVRELLRDVTQDVALQQPDKPLEFMYHKIGKMMGIEQPADDASGKEENSIMSCRVMIQCVGPSGKSSTRHLVKRSPGGSDLVLQEWRGEADTLVGQVFAKCFKVPAAPRVEQEVPQSPEVSAGANTNDSNEVARLKEQLTAAVERQRSLETKLREAEYTVTQENASRAQAMRKTDMIRSESYRALRSASLPGTNLDFHDQAKIIFQMQQQLGRVTSVGSVGEMDFQFNAQAPLGTAIRVSSVALRGSMNDDAFGTIPKPLSKTISSRQPRQVTKIGAVRSLPSVVTWWQQPVKKWGVLVMMRHGGTSYNTDGRFAGWDDPELTAQSVAQTIKSGEQLRGGTVFDVLITSSLKRSKQTARAVLDGMDAVDIPIIEDWRLCPRHWGALQGMTVKVVRKERDAAPPAGKASTWDQRYIGLSQTEMPTHESMKQVSNRVGMAWEELIVPLLKASKNVLIVSHGDTVRVLQGFMDGGFDVEWTRREAGKSLLSQQHPARQVESLRDLF